MNRNSSFIRKIVSNKINNLKKENNSAIRQPKNN